MTSPPSLAERFRSSQSSTSLTLASSSTSTSSSSRPTSTQQSGPSKSYRPKYHSRSHSSTPSSFSSSSHSSPKPKVLPFPDLPVRPVSRDGSRAGSPTGRRSPISSPGLTPRGSSTNLSGLLSPSGAGGFAMVSGRSMDGTVNREGRSSPLVRSQHSQSTSPTFTSPLASSSTPHLGLAATSFRPRALTAPSPVDIPRSADSRAASPHPHSAAAGSSYISPTSPPTFSPTSPPTLASGSGSSANLAYRPYASSDAFAVPPPTPEKDLPKPIPKPAKKASTNSTSTIQPPTGYIPIAPAAVAQPLQEHLYRSFLSGECADVRLWVRNWGVGWLVHKMVLVQAGFFHSLFLGGFSETGVIVKPSSRKGKERATGDEDDDWKGENVELRFDDPNITREAFEISLSRLYSSHPRLLFPVALLPTPSHPLTPVFPSLISPSSTAAASLPLTTTTTPQQLLSLLATTIYLGHTPLMREVLSAILRTVGPGTIGRYVGFALGDGCGSDEQAGRGLEGVARPLPKSMCEEEPEEAEEEMEADQSAYHQSSTHRDSTDSADSKAEEDCKVGSLPHASFVQLPTATEVTAGGVHRTISNASTIRAYPAGLGMSSRPADISILPRSTFHRDVTSSLQLHATLPHFYGFASDKIGEACACWLSRWGMNVLAAEMAVRDNSSSNVEPYRVFQHRGIPASFLRGLLSSDSLWVKGEMERYEATRDILNMRRRGWEAEWEHSHHYSEEEEDEEGWEGWDDDEEQLGKVFAEGIYYSHMSFDDLSMIANDIDPNTDLPYAPLNVLQAAHWAAADLKTRIIANDPASLSQSPALVESDEAELGLTVTSAQLSEASKRSTRRMTPRSRVASPSTGSPSGSGSRRGDMSSSSLASSFSLTRRNVSGIFSSQSSETTYHPIPTDDTHRAGAGGLLFLAANTSAPIQGMSGLPDLGPSIVGAGLGGSDDESGSSGKKKVPPAGEKSCFGLQNGSRTFSEITSSLTPTPTSFFHPPPSTPSSEARWTSTQPFRFSVEFWDVDTLPEKERLYSTTHFHAGSWWNVYVQTIRKKDKGTQLGVYLHRQSLKEGVPRASRPSTDRERGNAQISQDESGVLEARGTRVEARRERRSEGDTSRGLSTTRAAEAVGSAVISGSPPVSSSSMQRGAYGAVSSDGDDREEDMVGVETYKDARRTTRAYFSITCASALGTALIRFSSSPDNFTLSQSWGWKSSALRSEEYLAVPPSDGEGVLGWSGKISAAEAGQRGSLRATVVVGVI